MCQDQQVKTEPPDRKDRQDQQATPDHQAHPDQKVPQVLTTTQTSSFTMVSSQSPRSSGTRLVQQPRSWVPVSKPVKLSPSQSWDQVATMQSEAQLLTTAVPSQST